MHWELISYYNMRKSGIIQSNNSKISLQIDRQLARLKIYKSDTVNVI